jgi:hypothetical protein
MKTCTKCKVERPLDMFSVRGKKQPHLRLSHCKPCVAERSRGWYRRNYEPGITSRKPGTVKSQRARQKIARDLLDDLKDAPCEDCGVRFPPEAMDFDHLPGFPKVKPTAWFQISLKAPERDLERLIEEIQKCSLVCANCHRVRTVHRLRRIAS